MDTFSREVSQFLKEAKSVSTWKLAHFWSIDEFCIKYIKFLPPPTTVYTFMHLDGRTAIPPSQGNAISKSAILCN